VREDMEWISVKDRLPRKDGDYIVYTPSSNISKVRKCSYTVLYGWGINEVTHWMPLPSPPKE
jgi:hypothetical protein